VTAGRPPGPAYRTSCARFHKALPRKRDTYRLQVAPAGEPALAAAAGRGRRPLALLRVAAELFLGVETVKTHVRNVLAKLGARDRVQAVITAFESGFIR
jgi:hypothetical protein